MNRKMLKTGWIRKLDLKAMMAKQIPLAFRIIRLLWYKTDQFTANRIASRLDADWSETERTLGALEDAQLAYGRGGEWAPWDSDVWKFLNSTPGEFTQAEMAEVTGMSRKWVSIMLSRLLALGLVTRRSEALERGGRRFWYKRI